MFENFTERAKMVIYIAQEEAKKLGHDFLGTEHLLYGLVTEGNGVAARALQELGVEPQAIARSDRRHSREGRRGVRRSGHPDPKN